MNIEPSPFHRELKGQPAKRKQNDNFAGTAKKKGKGNEVVQRSLVQVPSNDEVFDSNDES